MRPLRLVAISLLIPLTAYANPENTSGVPLPATPAFTDADKGRQIAVHQDTVDRGWVDEVSRGRMTLVARDGDTVERSFTRMARENAKDGDKTTLRFLSPAEIKGVASLTHENSGGSDDNWLYLPANKRTRRISGAGNTASFQGTEFTYEDLGNIDPAEYEWQFVEQTTLKNSDPKAKGPAVYKLSARPTYSDSGYTKLYVYINAAEWRYERIEYFDKAGRHLKTRNGTQWNLLHGRFWRAKRLEITNHQTGKSTLLELDRQFVNLSLYPSKKTGKPRKNLPESVFTARALAR